MKPVVAAFDFDGTLCRDVSGLRFFRAILGEVAYGWFWVRRLPEMICYSRRWCHEACLVRINRHVFSGRDAAQVAQAASRFLGPDFDRHLVPAAFECLQAHLARGERCVIVSRGYEVYLRPWAASLGIADVLATRLVTAGDGRLTGEMPEPSCDGEVKPARLLGLLGPREGYELYAYGDGPGDFALLAEADRAFIRVGPGFAPWSPIHR